MQYPNRCQLDFRQMLMNDDREFEDCVSDATGSDDEGHEVDHQTAVPTFGWVGANIDRSLSGNNSEYLDRRR